MNWLDADLYEYAQRRMQQGIDAAAQFDADLRRFRRSNSLVSTDVGSRHVYAAQNRTDVERPLPSGRVISPLVSPRH